MPIQARKELAVEASEENARDKILSAAGEVFAEQGFEGATIRAITERAGVNVAAVNYHFRDKAELYTRVVTDACSARAAYHEAMAEAVDSPEERLRSLIHHFLEYLLDPVRPNWKRRLLAREMANPTTALDELVDKNIRPLREEFLLPTLRETDQRLLQPAATELLRFEHYGSVSLFSPVPANYRAATSRLQNRQGRDRRNCRAHHPIFAGRHCRTDPPGAPFLTFNPLELHECFIHCNFIH